MMPALQCALQYISSVTKEGLPGEWALCLSAGRQCSTQLYYFSTHLLSASVSLQGCQEGGGPVVVKYLV